MRNQGDWADVVAENDTNSDKSASEFSFGTDDSEESFVDLGAALARPFDIHMLKESIETGSKILDHIEGKNVVLVIGKTGTGKSTFIQGIAGKKLYETAHSIECDGLIVENNVYDSQDALPDFAIGHEKMSQTKAFCSFVPEEQDGKEDVVYIDTPGFEDTHHEEIDVATSVMLSHIAKKCKSIRFVVLINYTSLLEDRGGAARSILRFTSAFVKDFSKDKKGFMFLFTHTNEISGVCDNITSSRKALQEELLRLKQGSNRSDKDVLDLLDFLTKSLHKGYLFADVLHPLESDFKALKTFIESKQKPITTMTMVDSCGLTASSKHRLSGEITAVLLKSRRYLQSKPPNTSAVKENHELLDYLYTQLSYCDVQKARDESEFLINRFIDETKVRILDEIAKGGTNDSLFSVDDALDVGEALCHLDVFGANNVSQHLRTKIHDLLVAMKETISMPSGNILETMEEGLPLSSLSTMTHTDARVLEKLHTWCKAFPEHADYYTNALHQLDASIKSTTKNVDGFEFSMELQPEAIAIFCNNVCFLNSIHHQLDLLLVHDLEIDELQNALEGADRRISEFLTASLSDSMADLERDSMDEEVLQRIAARLRVLGSLQLGLSEQQGFEDNIASIHNFSLELERIVPFQFNGMCIDAKEKKLDDLQEILHRMKGVLDICCGIDGFASENMCHNFQSLLDVIKERMKSSSESFLLNSMPSKSVLDCILNGKEAGLALNSLSTHAWFDEFLPEGTSIISTACMKVQKDFENLSETIARRILQYLDFRNVKCPDGFVEQKGIRQRPIFAMKQVKGFYSQFIEIESFAETTNNETIIATCHGVRSELSSRIGKSMEAINDSSKNSEYNFSESSKTEKYITKSNAHLKEIDLYQSVTRDPSDLAMLKSTKETVLARVDSFALELNQIFESTVDFEIMARLLCVLEKCEGDGNIFTSNRLPSFASSKDISRQALANRIAKVQSLITETSNWEEMSEQMAILQKGLCLENILKGDLAIHLNTLDCHMKNKETRVDSTIHEMIAAEDYSGIGEFLAPLANSKDQLQRKKFNRYLAEIDKSLTNRFGKTADFLPHGLPPAQTTIFIVQNLDKLIEIHNELSEYSGRGKSRIPGIHKLQTNAKKEIDTATENLNQKLCESLRQMELDCQKLNFVRLTSERKKAVEFVDIAKKSILNHNLKRHQRILEDFGSKLKSVPRLLDQFFKSNFKDALELISILRALRQASVAGDTLNSDLLTLYKDTKQDLNTRFRERIEQFQKEVNDRLCYADCIDILRTVQIHLNSGLKEHTDDDIVVNVEKWLSMWVQAQNDSKKIFQNTPGGNEKAHEEVAKKLDKLDPSQSNVIAKAFNSIWYGGSEYKLQKNRTENFCSEAFMEGRAALQKGDFAILDERVLLLIKWERAVNKHVKSIAKSIDALKTGARKVFVDTCTQLKEIVQGDSTFQYKASFDEFRNMILSVSFILETEDCQRAFALTNQLFCEKLEEEIVRAKDVLTLQSLHDFFEVKSIVEDARSFGDFMADHYAVFFEEMKNHSSEAGEDPWIKRIAAICHEHFSAGRDYRNIKHYITLGVLPSASYTDIKRAYHLLAHRFYFDNVGVQIEDADERFRKIKDSWEALDDEEHIRSRLNKKAFDRLVYGLGDCILDSVQRNVKDGRYDVVAEFLGRLYSLRELKDLVSPPLNSKHIEDTVNKHLCGHVEKVRISVTTLWSERNYKGLQETIEDLRKMEKHFKSGIIEQIESEVENLGKEALLCLSSCEIAKKRKTDFRRLFLRMGHVLVELPLFKDSTKAIISSVLQSCLDEAWGYSYLFEIGLSLQKGGDDDADESRIGQLLLSEFSHFKEVMTMVWNEETTQIPVEVTVQAIRGYIQGSSESLLPLDIKSDHLLDHFRRFDTRYKILLGEFLRADADTNALVRKTTKLADQMRPLSCKTGWSTKIKGVVPDLLAGIFALFTVLKSGDAYSRLESSSESSELGKKLLMKPHNIQVLTLLCMFGCGQPCETSLKSQLMQIRTGEGKSMILGAAATVLGLLGFRVRCVCYSEYLSCRDYGLFEDLFKRFNITEDIVYSKITTLSEDTTACKGDIRYLTESMVLGNLPQNAGEVSNPSILRQVNANVVTVVNQNKKPARPSARSTPHSSVDKRQLQSSPCGGQSKALEQHDKDDCMDTSARHTKDSTLQTQNSSDVATSNLFPRLFGKPKEEILLVDEVDVFFGPEFYGQTYNQVAQLQEPEIAEILKTVWREHSCNGRNLRLSDIKSTTPYRSLCQKMQGFEFLLDNEISLMLKHVKRVDEKTYFLDETEQSIGYKVMDSVSYNVTYGYRTVFAYLQEYDRGSIKSQTLERVLTMPVSCGQFSYSQIAPTRILGVSGTLDVMTRYEKQVLARYGVETYLHVPSVYGESNFSFDEGGDGLTIECNKSHFYHKICEDIQRVTAERRAAIVFFKDMTSVNEFTSSPFYHKLGRQKKVLSEDMVASEKDFVINKAATAKQITICPAVFGRGTDFFCKDPKVENSGGVHVIQTFLSEQRSEEVQIQGRTARQGKQGSYKLILLEEDLLQTFGISQGEQKGIPRAGRYGWLCDVRARNSELRAKVIDGNLAEATQKDKDTHEYFDALLASNPSTAKSLFKKIYLAMKRPIPSVVVLNMALAIDVTGSMNKFSRDLPSMLTKLLQGQDSIMAKLGVKFPELIFKLRVGVLGFRDIDDKAQQFEEKIWSNGTHFTSNMNNVLSKIQNMVSASSGGHDLAEDSLGAIYRSVKWNENGDWSGTINCLLVLTDAPAHGLAPSEYSKVANGDSYCVRHPAGLTAESVVGDLLAKDIDLFFCSFDPAATSRTEQRLANAYLKHAENTHGNEVACIPMVQRNQSMGSLESTLSSQHIIFILDESGSMQHSWRGVVEAYNKYVAKRLQSQSTLDLVSVVQFDVSARLTVDCEPITSVPNNLGFSGGGTCFSPAATLGLQAAQNSPSSHVPAVVFMSDGGTDYNDSVQASHTLSQLNSFVLQRYNSDLELHVIAFGGGADTRQLLDISQTSKIGRLHASADAAELTQVFENIAGGEDVSALMESQIGKRISDAVANKLSLEYVG
ncbi:MAG: hypothetical protein SGBAC_004162 [Bacillariaceae sp.]